MQEKVAEEIKKELAVREEILPIEKKLVAASLIIALVLLWILYWISWRLIAHV